jgi:hypothetical protein
MTTWLRNPMTVGTCGAPKTPADTKVLCAALARLFPCGWRCADHQPSRMAAPHLTVVR